MNHLANRKQNLQFPEWADGLLGAGVHNLIPLTGSDCRANSGGAHRAFTEVPQAP